MKPVHLLRYFAALACLLSLGYIIPVVYFQYALEESPTAGLAFCAIVKDQELTEWIDYHHRKGVSKFYVFDHNSTVPLVKHLHRYVRSELVEYRTLSMKECPTEHLRGNPQLCAYHTCLQNYGAYHRYMGFLDPDEYVVVRKQNISIVDVLERFKGYGGLTLNWMLFGSSGHVKKPEGGVLQNFHRCTTNEHVKTIVETRLTAGVSNMPHHFRYKWGHHAIDTNRHRVDGPWNPGLGNVPSDSLYDTMYINHYVLQSMEDYKSKMQRGSGDGNRKSIEFFNRTDESMDRDCEHLF